MLCWAASAAILADSAGWASPVSAWAAIWIGVLWVLLWQGIRRGVLPLPPPGWLRLGWRLPPSQASARVLGYAGLTLVVAGVGLLAWGAIT
jgi:hypothetical protein